MTEIIIVIEKWTKLGTIRKVPNSFRPCYKQTGADLIGEEFGNPTSRSAQLWDDNKDSPIPAKNAANGPHGE